MQRICQTFGSRNARVFLCLDFKHRISILLIFQLYLYKRVYTFILDQPAFLHKMSETPTSTPITVDAADDVVIAVADAPNSESVVSAVVPADNAEAEPLATQMSAAAALDLPSSDIIALAAVLDVEVSPQRERVRTTIEPAPEVSAQPTVSKDTANETCGDLSHTNFQTSGAAKPNGSSLGLLASYGSDASDADDDDDDDSDDDDIADVVVAATAAVRPAAVATSSATAGVSRETHTEATRKLNQFLEGGDYRVISDSSEEEDDSDDDDDAVVIVQGGSTEKAARQRAAAQSGDDDSDVEIVSKSREYVKAKGELGINELPPIEDLHISVPEAECVLLGKIFSIVEQLGEWI